MRTIRTLPRLDALARRTLEYRDGRGGPDALRQLADAATADQWGRAVEVTITTDPADAPRDCAER